MTPTSTAETVEVGNQYSLSLESHQIPRTSAASGGRRHGVSWVAQLCQFQLRFPLSTQTSTLSGPSSTAKTSHIPLPMPGQVLATLTYFAAVKGKSYPVS